MTRKLLVAVDPDWSWGGENSMSRPLVHLLCILCLLLAAPQVGARRVAAVDPANPGHDPARQGDELAQKAGSAAAFRRPKPPCRSCVARSVPTIPTRRARFISWPFSICLGLRQAEPEASVALFALASKYRPNLAKQRDRALCKCGQNARNRCQPDVRTGHRHVQQELRKLLKSRCLSMGQRRSRSQGSCLMPRNT